MKVNKNFSLDIEIALILKKARETIPGFSQSKLLDVLLRKYLKLEDSEHLEEVNNYGLIKLSDKDLDKVFDIDAEII